ncbi:hypothetical protein [Sulfurisphaera ohwakuensis]|uniref:Uncharacterized protein n=1 Tax=Sulfurisphaera ohwakuensis TaxID=69656 RepID=A0A650CF98_SULOH|nr:hypothetical protein [Sulfurisphaera ohwakuensis]MBB5255092.1 hypothetical protein [Sulfurisphaera ohwakuensis]QGR16484.1 hypothetical protein D1869_04165 [Sulfurisphaera ohwakuensis]
MNDIINFFKSKLKKKDLERVERCIISKRFTPESYEREFEKHITTAPSDLSSCRNIKHESDHIILLCKNSYVIDYGKIKIKVDLLNSSAIELLEYNIDALEYMTLVQILSLSKEGAIPIRDFYIIKD